jgi:hypothetical protein
MFLAFLRGIRDKRIHAVWLILLTTTGCGLRSPVNRPHQVADLAYQPAIAQPAYRSGKGPLVVIDGGHYNFHRVDGRYQPFANLLRRDGYRVRGNQEQFTAASLKPVDVLVIANALNKANAKNWAPPNPPAFTPAEVESLRNWVSQGGSLFLIVDHSPFPAAAGSLAKAFGIEFSNGYALQGFWQQGQAQTYGLGTGLVESDLTRGRNPKEKVTKIATFTGSAFRSTKAMLPVLVFCKRSLSLEAKKDGSLLVEDNERRQIEGWLQGGVMKVGRGRIAVFGEAAMFSAQLAGSENKLRGMNAPEARQNHQLLLNLIHWLTRVPGLGDGGGASVKGCR